ncbi:hypothetical protein HUF15_27825 [Streptomyces samsunensis]|uniref:Uncharacterized protein n=1 Tax=Streptomyces malaysiensis TaxID=92644 RepID=A0ABX6W215_STRMQ|nr:MULTISPECIES: hypothetical protein [Streptomyces]MCC4318743.1 hypothetical protein [Streptomyces malaysiensis]MCD9589299.1 hypothetical protein [Streptomyces sp. 8ZJF_21]NUH40526.1 hypothetical protein [Streptomyces samsunensis]QPI54680.1 hypothetical protein I1A49_06830 [Streptomyces solisilvae]UHH16079.1 hypothetical protein LUV23_06890 [Streptomyces sp. HNM0561]
MTWHFAARAVGWNSLVHSPRRNARFQRAYRLGAERGALSITLVGIIERGVQTA